MDLNTWIAIGSVALSVIVPLVVWAVRTLWKSEETATTYAADKALIAALSEKIAVLDTKITALTAEVIDLREVNLRQEEELSKHESTVSHILTAVSSMTAQFQDANRIMHEFIGSQKNTK